MGRAEVREKIRATKVGKPLHPNMVAAQREAVRRPKPEAWRRATSERMKAMWEKPEEHGLPPSHRWTDEGRRSRPNVGLHGLSSATMGGQAA
jgi:hypothetical protein